MRNIHKTAIVDPKAELGSGVEIGPYAIIGPKVVIGDNVRVASHVVIENRTTIGEGTEIYPFASIGQVTQDLKYKGEDAELVIGKNNKIREYVTMNIGTAHGSMITKVGDNNLFMNLSHIAHDCQVGNNTIFSNGATIAGHVVVEDYAIIGGLSAVKQYCRIGAHSMIGGMSGIESDIIPYGIAWGNRASLEGLNLVGLKRRGFSREAIIALKDAYAHIFEVENNNFVSRLVHIENKYPEIKEVQYLIDFLKFDESRPICKPKLEGA